MKFVKILGQTFEIQTTPVTQSQWFEIMGTKPFYFKNKSNNPVEQISWNDVQEFIKQLNISQKEFKYRLPYEVEWEFCCGNENDNLSEEELQKYSWFYKNSNRTTQEVGQKLPNKFGLYDMQGNVWEWTQSPYCKIKGIPDYEDAQYRVVRGGSWSDGARGLRSAYRSYFSPGFRGEDLGVRLVRTCIP